MEQIQTTQTSIQKTSPGDFFLHLLAIITLYASAISFGTLIFNYINYFIPDPLQEGSYIRDAISSGIRWSIATLIIVFPAYIITSWYLNKSYAVTPYKRNLRIRRWLIYFTLFVTALIIIGDLVGLVYGLLGGLELTLRFILKVLTVLFITGSVFWYYLWDIRKYKTE
ncbi:MAG: DUF5671 domain-containing protein [Patescibacteria group bacterium]